MSADEVTSPIGIPSHVDVPCDVPGLVLKHFAEWETDSCLPADGSWSVTVASSNTACQQAHFRSLHAAACHAARISDLVDWTDGDAIKEALPTIRAAIVHAEAHAHEIDHAYPAGRLIPFSNGPSIYDESGRTLEELAHAPSVEWEKSDDGLRCPTCGDAPRVHFEWMDQP